MNVYNRTKIILRNLSRFHFKNSRTFYQLPNTSSNPERNVVKSVVPDINIPNILLEEYIWSGLDKWHDKIALLCAETGRSYTYYDTYKKSKRVAYFLSKLPTLKEGDTIAVVLPTCPEFPIIMLGAIQVGLKVTTVNPSYTSHEMHKQMVASETKVIFAFPEYWPRIKEAVEGQLDASTVIIDYKKNMSIPIKTIRFSEITEMKEELKNSASRNVNHTIILPYSSGTTGVPKGVELTNKNITFNLYQINAAPFKLHRDAYGYYQEVALSVVPWFHLYGQVLGMFSLLSCGCKLVTVSKFQPQTFIDVLKEHRPTFAHLVPPLILFLANNPNVKPAYIEHLQTIVSAAAPLGAADIDRLLEKADNKINIFQAYGLTETSPLTHCQTNKVPNGVKMGGSGLLIPNTECKIVAVDDKTNTGLGPNQSGELLIRGPQVMKGYFKNPEATRATLEPDGWLRTGDIGRYDEDGHFFITDRLKELIKVKGFQVAPAELEELLRDYPDIEDAAVIGVPDSKFGEVPKAYVVLKKGAKFDDSKIHKYMSDNASAHKQLRGGIDIIASIPRNLSGKILRKELKNL